MNNQETLPYLIAQVSTVFKVSLEKLVNGINLHSGQVFVLFELWNSDGLTQISLAKNLNVSPPTINKMVKSLAENGFVTFHKCKTDGRLIRVFLTQKGSGIREFVEIQMKKLEEQIFSNLSETEKLVFFQLIGKIKDNLLSSTG